MDLKIDCPICSGVGKPIKQRNFMTPTKLYMTCNKCKSLFASEKATKRELITYYANYYSEENLDIPIVVKNSLTKTISTFSKFRTSNNAICDIGFGAGALLDAAQADGWNCFGSEFSVDAIAIGQSKGWGVHYGDLTSKDLRGPYDVLTIIETLEHVQDPKELLLGAAARLRSGGLLYGTTPNAGSINALILKQEWSVITFPEHPILVSKKALNGLLIHAGFKDISIKSRGINPYDLISKFKYMPNSTRACKSIQLNLTRVDFGYKLNSTFSRNFFMRMLKSVIMALIGRINIGDTLVFTAIKI